MLKKKIQQLNDQFAVIVTSAVGTMWCAYIFAGIAIWGGTGVHWDKPNEVVQWISQTFLQLVLLSIIMVGQKVLSDAADVQAKEMHDAVMEELELARKERADIRKMHRELHEYLRISIVDARSNETDLKE